MGFSLVVIGGGAAGIFGAIEAARNGASVIVLERTRQLLAKVRISGGGRCNVTHAAFEPRQLVQNYPRGSRELLGPFHRFGPSDTIDWFEQRGVSLKTEEDGRIFPTTNSSQTIIDCLLEEARALGVEIRLEQKITAVEPGFLVHFADGSTLPCERLLLATGSSPHGHAIAKSFGHTVVSPVPSLFTFNVPTSPLLDLMGIAVDAHLSIEGCSHETRGPVLLTHWGFSGPAALKLSAWAARDLHEMGYKATLVVNWLPDHKTVYEELLAGKKRLIEKESLFGLPKGLWGRLVELAGLSGAHFDHASKGALRKLAELCCRQTFQVEGKTTYKQEFVTCGGVNLKEINFKQMESRILPGLHFAGEVIDVDGVTGGFNFQNAWTGGWIVGQACLGG